MKKVLLSLVLLLAGNFWSTETRAAWRMTTGEPIKNVQDLEAYLDAHEGSGLFVFESQAFAVHAGAYWSAPNAYLRSDYITDAHIIRVIQSDETQHAHLQAPRVYLQSYSLGTYWNASTTQNGFYFGEDNRFALHILNASEWVPMNYEKREFTAEDDAIAFCGSASATTDSTKWGFLSYPYSDFVESGAYVGYYTGVQSRCQFYLYEVEEYTDYELDLVSLISDCTADAGLYVAGDQPGYFPQANIDALQGALRNAEAVLADATASEEQLKEAYDRLKGAYDTLAASMIEFDPNSWYYIISDNPLFFEKQGVQKAMYDDGTKPMWGTFDPNKPAQVFQFKKTSDGSYEIQNLKTGRYIGGIGTTTETISRRQALTLLGNGAFNIKDLTGTYHANNHASGAGVGSNIVSWAGGLQSSSAWRFQEISSPEKLDTLRQIIVQENLTEAFEEALAEARADSAAGYVIAIRNVITDVAQLSTNAQEPSEGPIANLLDGDTETFFHTEWSVTTTSDTHYLQAKLNEPLQNISLYWYKRSGNSNNRPARVTILGSNDGENFDSIMVLEEGLPSAASEPEYFSPVLDLGKPYSYIRLRVDSTNTKTKFFTMSEFAITADGFPMDEDLSVGLRPDMLDAYAALKAAIDEALAKDPATVVQADIDALTDAIAAFNAIYPDTMLLSDAISRSQAYASATAADPATASMGYCTDASAINAVAEAVASARAALDANPKMTRAEINAEVAKLEVADKAFFDALVKPEPNKWYFIESLCTAEARNDGEPYTYGTIVYANGYNIGSNVLWGDDASTGLQSAKYLWKLVPMEGKDDVFAVQNIGSGYYLGEDRGLSQTFQLSDSAIGFKLEFVADGQLSMRQDKEGSYLIHAQESGTALVPWTSGAGSASVWTFIESNEEEQQAERTALDNGAEIYCLPYDVTGEFYAYNDNGYDEEASAYEITDAKYDENGNITAIGLSLMNVEDVIPAGTPFILAFGDQESEEEGESINVFLSMVFGSELSTEVKPANGLVGVMTSTAIDQAGLGYFDETGSLVSVEQDGSATISSQRGYIDGRQIVASGSAEIYLPVNGGVITDIAQAVKDANTIVSVYTVDGQLVRQDVKASEATKGLAKGLYVIGGKVVYVK